MKIIQCSFDRHAQAILDIFNEAILNSTALYEYKPRTMDRMREWFGSKINSHYPVLGVENETGMLVGFASYGMFRAWPAYKYSIEHSIYVHHDHRGQGIGTKLLKELIAVAGAQDFHVMIGGVDAENEASVDLHEKLGFIHAGTIKQAGFKFNRWLDLSFYQLTLATPANPIDE